MPRLSCLGRPDDAESLSTAAVGIYGGEEVAIPWVALLVQIRNLQGRLDELKPSMSEPRTGVDAMPQLISSLVRARRSTKPTSAQIERDLAVIREGPALHLAPSPRATAPGRSA